jgi:membrane dipeptidase
VSAKLVAYNAKQAAFEDSTRGTLGADSNARTSALAAWQKSNPAPRATLADVADHMDHIKAIAGAAHVGIGSDFDGITEVVQGLEDVSKFPDLLAELMRRGWSDKEIEGVAGENVLRALAQAEAVSRRLRAARPASTKTIQELDRRITP